MKSVLLAGAGIAVVDGIVLGVSLGVGATGVAVAALVLGLAAAVWLASITPDPVPVQHSMVTLGVPAREASAVEEQEQAVPETVLPLPLPLPSAEVPPAPAPRREPATTLTPIAV